MLYKLKTTILFSILLISAFSFSTNGVLIFLSYPSVSDLPILLISVLLAASSVLAIIGYHNQTKSGVSFHFFSLFQQIVLLIYGTHAMLLLLLILSFCVLIFMSVRLGVAPLLISFFLGLSITLLSILFQKFGPAMGSYGNAGCEVVPNNCVNGQMMGKILGAGFPLQFILDNLATSVRYQLGLEDHFLLSPFLINILFYTGISYGFIKLLQKFHQNRTSTVTA